MIKKRYSSPSAELFELLKPKTILVHFSGEADFIDFVEETPSEIDPTSPY